MRTNAWVTIEKTRALSWRDWWRWYNTDPETRGPEPPLTNYEKKAVLFITDQEYLFRSFNRPTIATREWIMLSLYDVTEAQIATGYAQLGDAASGGDFACAGFWTWDPSWDYSYFQAIYSWLPAQVLKFMPDVCQDPPDCASYVPATEIVDVNLLCGQPPRQFPN